MLCADCVHEAVGDGASPSAGSIVHAWIDAGPGVCCEWCGEIELDGEEGAAGSEIHPPFRTVVEVGELVTVMGSLPGMAWRPVGSIAIRGDVSFLARDRARELADALRLVAARMDACADERYGAIEPSRLDRAEG